MKKIIIALAVFLGLVAFTFILYRPEKNVTIQTEKIPVNENIKQQEKTKEIITPPTEPMEIKSLRSGNYPGGDFEIERTLPDGSNYKQFVVSYKSEGLKIYGLLTIPLGSKPEGGFPAIIFVHGYIPPEQYSTTGNYPTYQAMLARSGMITFKPDLRGHGQSEGEPVSAHFSEKYVVDTLHAISYLKNHKDVNKERLGYWGHSNGGEIGLRTVLISPDIKAAIFWAGVVGNYKDMFETYNEKIPFLRDANKSQLVRQYGLPSANPEFWNKLDPYSFLSEISAPIQLHHGTNDTSVPVELSVRLKEELEKAGRSVEYFEYAGDDHNISKNSILAWERSTNFFKKNL